MLRYYQRATVRLVRERAKELYGPRLDGARDLLDDGGDLARRDVSFANPRAARSPLHQFHRVVQEAPLLGGRTPRRCSDRRPSGSECLQIRPECLQGMIAVDGAGVRGFTRVRDREGEVTGRE